MNTLLCAEHARVAAIILERMSFCILFPLSRNNPRQVKLSVLSNLKSPIATYWSYLYQKCLPSISMNVVKPVLASGTTGIALHCNDKNQINITGQSVVQALNSKCN
jgi:hypothetical protein